MKAKGWKTGVVLGTAAVAGLALFTVAQAAGHKEREEKGTCPRMQKSSCDAKAEGEQSKCTKQAHQHRDRRAAPMDKSAGKQLTMAKQYIADAREAVREGNHEEALAALEKAEQAVGQVHERLAAQKAAKEDGKVANARCPMRGTAIDPAEVPENLTRTFRGRRVGFCCAGCPKAWDKLSEAEKQTKLDAAIPEEGATQ